MHAGGWLLVALYGAWLLASILANFQAAETLRRWDFISFLPQWKFFAPQPATHDFVLLYRCQHGNGTLTGWVEVPLSGPRHWWNCLWNPGKRSRKALFDIATDLTIALPGHQAEAIRISIPYLHLLNHVSRRHVEPFVAVQFAVMLANYSRGSEGVELIYRSEMHPIHDHEGDEPFLRSLAG